MIYGWFKYGANAETEVVYFVSHPCRMTSWYEKCYSCYGPLIIFLLAKDQSNRDIMLSMLSDRTCCWTISQVAGDLRRHALMWWHYHGIRRPQVAHSVCIDGIYKFPFFIWTEHVNLIDVNTRRTQLAIRFCLCANISCKLSVGLPLPLLNIDCLEKSCHESNDFLPLDSEWCFHWRDVYSLCVMEIVEQCVYC